MKIILGNEKKKYLDSKYILLELDSFEIAGIILPSYCVLDIQEDVPISEISQLSELRENHAKLIENYRIRNWDFCEEVLKHLKSCFGGHMNSFYDILHERINKEKNKKHSNDWNWIIKC